MKKIISSFCLLCALSAAESGLTGKVGSLYHFQAADDKAQRSFIRGYGAVNYTADIIYGSVYMEFNHNASAGKPSPAFNIRDAYVGLKLKDELIDVCIGHTTEVLEYAYYFRPSYAGSHAFFAPLAVGDSVSLTVAPGPISVSAGIDLDFSVIGSDIAGGFGGLGFEVPIGDEAAGRNFQGDLEYYVEGEREDLTHTLFLGLKAGLSSKLDIFVQTEGGDISDFTHTGHSAFGVELKKLFSKDKFSLTRVRVEGYIPYSSAMGKPAVYADFRIALGKLYFMPVFTRDLHSGAANKYGFRIGAEHKF